MPLTYLTFVIFSGLPGTGKTALASRLGQEMGWPVLGIDHVAARMKESSNNADPAFWDAVITELLEGAQATLHAGASVIVDSLFIDRDRFHAAAIANSEGALFRPVHTHVSDEDLWKSRVVDRLEASGGESGVASWAQTERHRRDFRVWEPGTALFVDGVHPIEDNLAIVREYVTDPEYVLRPLPETSFTPGSYHG